LQTTLLDVDETETIEPISEERLAWVGERLAAISYKHWVFEITEAGPGLEPLVHMSFATVDSYNQSQPFTAECFYRIEDVPTTDEAFGNWVVAAIAAAELHEVAENVRFRGQQVIDPHSPALRAWDGGLYIQICESARINGNPFHDVIYAGAAEMVKTYAVPPEISMKSCTDHLTRNVAPRRVKPRAIAA
jgi:hypothetical protein